MGDKDTSAHRLIVTRWKKEQPELRDKDPYAYHAVLDGLECWTAGLTPAISSELPSRKRARQRGDQERLWHGKVTLRGLYDEHGVLSICTFIGDSILRLETFDVV